VKPISEWTDAELRDCMDRFQAPDYGNALAAQVLRLRERIRLEAAVNDDLARQIEQAEADAAYGRAARVADWQARSLAAEAEIEEWKRIVRGWEQTHEQHRRAVGFPTNELIDRMRKAEAALARVRALCDYTEADLRNEGTVSIQKIRAAIEGTDQ
jgi:hypothetical protein